MMKEISPKNLLELAHALNTLPSELMPGLDSYQGYCLYSKPSALAEEGYYRETPEKLARIIPLHNQLSNRFSKWLQEVGIEDVKQEKNYVDVVFSKQGVTFLAELKICYGATPTIAIREALGQLLEYNIYPGRSRADKWLIVINQKPSDSDIEYINALRKAYNLPLSLMWETHLGFQLVAGEDIFA